MDEVPPKEWKISEQSEQPENQENYDDNPVYPLHTQPLQLTRYISEKHREENSESSCNQNC